MNREIIDDDVHNICCADLPWKELKGKRIVVTGITGMIPAYIVEVLARFDCTIFGFTRDRGNALHRFDHVRNLYIYNIEDIDDEMFDLASIDYIIHGASPANPRAIIEDPLGVVDANITLLSKLLHKCSFSSKTKILYLSAGEAVGRMPDIDRGLVEDDCGLLHVGPRSTYGLSKLLVENMLQQYALLHPQITAVSARIFHTFGPGMRLEEDDRVFAVAIKAALQKTSIPYTCSYRDARAMCYITDTVEGLFTLLFKGRNGVYNVGSDTPYKIVEFIQMAIHEGAYGISCEAPECVAPNSVIYPNIDKMKYLGWEPKMSIFDAFMRTLKYYKED